jgi:LysR family transcriptional activator of nhaA
MYKNLNRINLNHLYHFWAVAKEGSIKDASIVLNLTSSTISTQIKTLEFNIGKDLFIRRNKQLMLNDYGKTLFEYAECIFSQGEEILSSIKSGSVNQTRVIRIGMLPTMSKDLVYRIIKPFVYNPAIHIKCVEGENKFLLKELSEGNFDMIIFDKVYTQIGNEYLLLKIIDRTFYAVCSGNFTDQQAKFPGVLENLPFINYSSYSELNNQISTYFQNNKIGVKTIAEIDDINLIKIFTEKGLCFSILPKSAVEESILEGKLVNLGQVKDIMSSALVLVRNNQHNSEVISILREAFPKSIEMAQN